MDLQKDGRIHCEMFISNYECLRGRTSPRDPVFPDGRFCGDPHNPLFIQYFTTGCENIYLYIYPCIPVCSPELFVISKVTSSSLRRRIPEMENIYFSLSAYVYPCPYAVRPLPKGEYVLIVRVDKSPPYVFLTNVRFNIQIVKFGRNRIQLPHPMWSYLAVSPYRVGFRFSEYRCCALLRIRTSPVLETP